MGDRWDGTVPPGGHHLQIDASHPGLVLVHETPPLYFCEDFLSPSECDELVAICDPLLKRSRTDSGVTNTRTSQSCHLERTVGAAPTLLRKASKLTGKPTRDMEIPYMLTISIHAK